MRFAYSIANISITPGRSFQVLRTKTLIDDQGVEHKLNDLDANYRCVLHPNSDIDAELAKLSGGGATLDADLLTLLKSTLAIWWTPEVIEASLSLSPDT